MSISVPSRFACLKIEDDEVRSRPSSHSQNKKKVTEVTSSTTVSKGLSNKKTSSKPSENKNLVSSKKHKQRQQQQVTKQWEEWKKRDDEEVNDNFEQDLQSAILQSKIDYEKKKTAVNKSTNNDDKKSQTGKKKKSKTMSLDQFLGTGDKVTETENVDEEKGDLDINDEKFFEKMVELAKKEVSRGKVEEKRREREANIDDVITASQYQQKLEKERNLNKALQSEVDYMKQELTDIKAQNKTLCAIIGHGNMKDKADVLLELERLASVKNELTEEVSRLHTLLEQERSKVAALLADKHKDNKKRKKNGL